MQRKHREGAVDWGVATSAQAGNYTFTLRSRWTPLSVDDIVTPRNSERSGVPQRPTDFEYVDNDGPEHPEQPVYKKRKDKAKKHQNRGKGGKRGAKGQSAQSQDESSAASKVRCESKKHRSTRRQRSQRGSSWGTFHERADHDEHDAHQVSDLCLRMHGCVRMRFPGHVSDLHRPGA
jgi:DNA-directed RNA polymerase subunit N (RpoN/RPB10)